MKYQAAGIHDVTNTAQVLENVFSFLKIDWKRPHTGNEDHGKAPKDEVREPSQINTLMKPSTKTSGFSSFLDVFGPSILSSIRIAVLNVDFRFVWVNEKFCDLLKREVNCLLGKRFDDADLFCPEPEFFAEIFKMTSSGKKWSGEIKSKSNDGRVFWMKTNITPITDEQERIVSYLVLTSNITATKNALVEKNAALEKLMVSEARYRALVENQSDLVWLCKADGTLIYANQSFCSFTGKTFRDLQGTNLDNFPLNGVPAEYTKMIFSLSTMVPEIAGVFQMQDKNGKLFWISLCAKGLFDLAGNMYEILIIGRDVSDLKNAEIQKQSYIQDLERIAFMASHNVRGPIATMLGLLQLLKMDAIESDRWEDVLNNFHKCIVNLDLCTRELGAFINGRQASE